MKLLTGFTSQPKQSATFYLSDGAPVYFYMQYNEQQTGWFANLIWGDREINGLRLTTSPNLLLKWRHLIPFGLAILTDDNSEPLSLDVFSTGTAKMYLLNADDVEAVSTSVFSP
jgi:hypothetical protein